MSGPAAAVECTLRDESVEDQAFLLELYRSCRPADPNFSACPDEQRERILATEHGLRRQTISAVYPDACGSIIEIDGERAGEIIVDRTRSSLRLIEIALIPRFRDQGVGTELLRRLCDEAAERHVPLDLRVAAGNRGARRLYRRLGFIETAADDLFVDMTLAAW